MQTSNRTPTASVVAALAFATAAGIGSAAADPISDFYKGRQVNIFVGSAPGGGYDLYARLLGRHLGRQIPGSPTIVINNMPGAGQTRAAAHVALVAPKDGSAIAAVSSGALMTPLLGGPKIQFDPSKFLFLGSATQDSYVCVARAGTAARTIRDTATTEIIIGGSGGSTRDHPKLLAEVLGLKVKLIIGYPGTKEIILAMEKGEVDGLCGIAQANIAAQYSDQLSRGVIRWFVQESVTAHPELHKLGIPMATELAKTPADRQILELSYSRGLLGRPYVIAPEVPPDRVAALQKAFMDTMHDAELVAEAKRTKTEISPVDGIEAKAILTRAYATPPAVAERARKLLDIPEGG